MVKGVFQFKHAIVLRNFGSATRHFLQLQILERGLK
jgi:hypothetical protein